MAEGEATTSQMNKTLTEQKKKMPVCPLGEGATETLHGQGHAVCDHAFFSVKRPAV